MKCVYDASTSLEAYMVLNMLEVEGIAGRVDGEHLQGGVGELQAIGVARVMVNTVDYELAKKLIREWDAVQSQSDMSRTKKRTSVVPVWLFGFISGVLLVFVLQSNGARFSQEKADCGNSGFGMGENNSGQSQIGERRI